MNLYRSLDGFTLAEVLIALVLIGVVAALVIPMLITKVAEQEFVSRSQKAISIMNQAVKMQYAIEGNTYVDIAEQGSYSTQYIYDNFFKKRMNIIGEGTMKLDNGDTLPCIYTSDGMGIAIVNDITQIYIDLNGAKPPNSVTLTPDNYNDIIAISPSKSILDKHDYAHAELEPTDYGRWGLHYGAF